jgi:uncharacterized protein
VLGSAVGGIIILTNIRILLRSDWIDASNGVRSTSYTVIYVVWAAALLHSVRQYRADRDEERRIIAEAEAAGEKPDEKSPAPAA